MKVKVHIRGQSKTCVPEVSIETDKEGDISTTQSDETVAEAIRVYKEVEKFTHPRTHALNR